MIRRRFMGQKTLVAQISRYYDTNTAYVQADWVSFDLFLVGGGGSGGSWITWGYGPGGGGSGGECVTIKDLKFPAGTRLGLIIGRGGASVGNKSGLRGNPGGNTTVEIGNDFIYTARGGNPGRVGVSDANEQQNKPIWSSGAKGYDQRSDAIGLIHTSSSNLFDVHDKSGNVLLRNLDSTIYTYSNPYYLRLGVPEFHEENNLTHAAGGASCNHILASTDTSYNNGGDFQNTAEGIWMRGGQGSGGGGAGAYYRTGTSGKGGNGCVVIRYYTYK